MRTKSLFAVALAVSAVPAAFAEVVYQNTTTGPIQLLSTGTNEVGDEIILGGAGRKITDFNFQYYTSVGLAGAHARVRFYNNDGTLYDPQSPRPLSVFYDSGLFPIAAAPGNGITLDFSVGGGQLPANLTLPNDFTFSIQFSDIGAGTVGVALFDPPTVGNNYDDYWFNQNSTDWQRRTNVAFPINFGASLQAVPEPSFWSLCIAGGMAGFFLLRRRNDRA